LSGIALIAAAAADRISGIQIERSEGLVLVRGRRRAIDPSGCTPLPWRCHRGHSVPMRDPGLSEAILGHIYIGSLGMEGAFEAMGQGHRRSQLGKGASSPVGGGGRRPYRSKRIAGPAHGHPGGI